MENNSAIVQLVQVNQRFMQLFYLPYAAGLLQAYVMRHAQSPGRYTFLPTIYTRLPMEQALAEASLAQIVGFSTYTWNFRYSLELARQLKALRPETLILFGGPHIPDRPEALLRAQPFIDVVSHGEGEQIFLKLLEAWPGKDWEDIPGISYLGAGGQFHTHPRPERIKDLDEIPSPYLLNLFAPLLKEHPGEQWIGLWETNRGCPFTCSFCDWGAAVAAKVTRFGLERLKQEVDWFGRNDIKMVFNCDANWGMLKRDLEITEEMVKVARHYGAPSKFYIQNAKNVTERAYEIQKMISLAGLNQAVTLSLQSVTPEVLVNVRRENISLQSYHDLQQRFRAEGITTYTDILIGLPGETFETFVAGLEQVIGQGQHHLVRFYNVSLLPNAEMAQPEYRELHGLETVELLFVEPLTSTRVDLPETQEVVIATKTLPKDQWRRVRVLAWWAELVYFNRKLLQLPIVLLQQYGIPYGESFRFLLEGEWPETTIWAHIRGFLNHKAAALQQGDPELCPAKIQGRGDLWLTVEEHLITGLSQSQAWPQFFMEALKIFEALLASKGVRLPPGVLEESMALSACMLQAIVTEAPFELKL
ncbi:MAG: radical SAM protein, partial [Candidatus Sericytochromatia bacterium]